MGRMLVVMAIATAAYGSYAATAHAELRDPFISIMDLEKKQIVEQKAMDLSNAALKGIIWNNALAVAVINEELVMAGDTWRDFKVEKVEKESVVLSIEGKEYTLSLDDGKFADKKEAPAPENHQLSLPEEEPFMQGIPQGEGGNEWR